MPTGSTCECEEQTARSELPLLGDVLWAGHPLTSQDLLGHFPSSPWINVYPPLKSLTNVTSSAKFLGAPPQQLPPLNLRALGTAPLNLTALSTAPHPCAHRAVTCQTTEPHLSDSVAASRPRLCLSASHGPRDIPGTKQVPCKDRDHTCPQTRAPGFSRTPPCPSGASATGLALT